MAVVLCNRLRRASARSNATSAAAGRRTSYEKAGIIHALRAVPCVQADSCTWPRAASGVWHAACLRARRGPTGPTTAWYARTFARITHSCAHFRTYYAFTRTFARITHSRALSHVLRIHAHFRTYFAFTRAHTVDGTPWKTQHNRITHACRRARYPRKALAYLRTLSDILAPRAQTANTCDLLQLLL